MTGLIAIPRKSSYVIMLADSYILYDTTLAIIYTINVIFMQ